MALTINGHAANDLGCLGSVCLKFFNVDGLRYHEGCPFQKVCLVDNKHPKESVALSIYRGVTSAPARDGRLH